MKFDSTQQTHDQRFSEIHILVEIWAAKVDTLLANYPHVPSVDEIRTFLAEQHEITAERAIFFVSGHVVFDRFVLGLVKHEVYSLREQKKLEIENSITDMKVKEQRKATYFNQTNSSPETKFNDAHIRLLHNDDGYPWIARIGEKLRKDFAQQG